MKLLTHNMLMSPGTRYGYPLAIEVEKMETVESEFNGEFMARMVEKLDYAALLGTLGSVRSLVEANAFSLHAAYPWPFESCEQLAVKTELPKAVPSEPASDDSFLRALHHALMEIEILEGNLVCPETSKKFPIKDGIPSML